MPAERIYEEMTPKGHLVVTAHFYLDEIPYLLVDLDGKRVADAKPKYPAAGAELSVGRVDFVGERGRAVRAALDGYLAAHSDEVARRRAEREAEDAAEEARWDRIEREDPAGAAVGITGDEADIEANYPGRLAAFRRDEPSDRTPRHKGSL